MFGLWRSRAQREARGRELAQAWMGNVRRRSERVVKVQQHTSMILAKMREVQETLPHIDEERKARWLSNMRYAHGITDTRELAEITR